VLPDKKKIPPAEIAVGGLAVPCLPPQAVKIAFPDLFFVIPLEQDGDVIDDRV